MKQPTIDEIRLHHEQIVARTPAPWLWAGAEYRNGPLYLVSANPRQVVMTFARRGLAAGQPVFHVWPEGAPHQDLVKASDGLIVREAPYRDDIADIDNPHARYLRDAPTYVGTLLTVVDGLRATRPIGVGPDTSTRHASGDPGAGGHATPIRGDVAVSASVRDGAASEAGLCTPPASPASPESEPALTSPSVGSTDLSHGVTAASLGFAAAGEPAPAAGSPGHPTPGGDLSC